MDINLTDKQPLFDALYADENVLLRSMMAEHLPNAETRAVAVKKAIDLIDKIRSSDTMGLMEVMLAEYGLSTDEGVALMCLAEALLRVPDAATMDDLIEDKIAPSAWGEHLGKSSSSLVNASTWALMLTGKVLSDDPEPGIASTLRSAIKRLGEPVIRLAVTRAMREMGNQFVLGETIEAAIERASTLERDGFTYSYDMLGEAARTAADADAYFAAYREAITQLAKHSLAEDARENPGISIKLSALHPRYEVPQAARVEAELIERVIALCQMAKDANMGLNIDAEEADRLSLSLSLIETLIKQPDFKGWDGFGVVVQAYGKRALPTIDWLYDRAVEADRKIMVRLVKGAYWDTEIKRSQVEGIDHFPVFTRKASTDVSYICCSRRLLALTDRIYPQFATHNAHSVAAILAEKPDPSAYEFQRLHGMGEDLHRIVRAEDNTRCRIYAPVGAHRDLLAYLVRRLLENGANSSFVNQIVDEAVPASEIAADPFEALHESIDQPAPGVAQTASIFEPHRENSKGFDLHDDRDLEAFYAARAPFAESAWDEGSSENQPVINPARPADRVGSVTWSNPETVPQIVGATRPWMEDASARALKLRAAAALYEKRAGEIFALLAREAGKTPKDAVSELREAVDFLYYYAGEAERLADAKPIGRFACVSPWNFPLAIFTGQIAAALAAGNAVIAKPAEETPLIAQLAVSLLHHAGIPSQALQLVQGDGAVGAALIGCPEIGGVCFTGSTETAQAINRTMAQSLSPAAPLIAETGGLNAMIVDSTALPEQAVRDIVASAFQSAGQRCSALRILYVQDDIADGLLEMLYGAMDELTVGDPWHLATDVGPIIHHEARADIQAYIDKANNEGRVLKSGTTPDEGTFVAPTVIEVSGIADMSREIFGPVLHVSRFKADKLPKIVDDINARGFGLTFGLHTRIDDRVEMIASKVRAGNIYINRNQIGAIVASQPFGGEGLSGTGPKAGGPHYVRRFAAADRVIEAGPDTASFLDFNVLEAALRALPIPPQNPLETIDLPGPTGESNRLSTYPRGRFLCLGLTAKAAKEQVALAKALGNSAIGVAPGASGDGCIDGAVDPEHLKTLNGFDAVAIWADDETLRPYGAALAARPGKLIPLTTSRDFTYGGTIERHLCVDTTASGGNASLLAAAE